MIRHLVAIDREHGMARNGRLPWHIPEDSRYFVRTSGTHGGNVLMGSKTLESMKHPMADRQNFVASRLPDYTVAGATTVLDLPAFLSQFRRDKDLWIIGGAEIFAQTLDVASELYITQIDAVFDCDRFYPVYQNDFELANQSVLKTHGDLSFRFCVYRRRV